jgi:hypothetical protein
MRVYVSLTMIHQKNGFMFQKDLAKELIGQDTNIGPPTYGMERHLLKGAALSKFDESALAQAPKLCSIMKTS